MRHLDPELPDFLQGAINLASLRLGAKALLATDEFFAPKERMLQESEPVFIPGKFDDHGKWMDGWETQRRRNAGHDFCMIQLGVKGEVAGFDIDTRHFTGNYPRAASVEGCLSDDLPGETAEWRTLLPAKDLGPDQRHFFKAEAGGGPVNWVRLHIYPDGGVARFKVYGAPFRAWKRADPAAVHELSAVKNGGRILAYSDAHYGDVWALLSEGRGLNMGDGWETRRRREPGYDWILIQLGHPGRITRLEIDTAHFKGNFPHSASIEAALVEEGSEESTVTQSLFWKTLLPSRPMSADAIHGFAGDDLADLGVVSHLKLNIFPDGGVSRLRAFGKLAAPGEGQPS